jgi:putative flippase GtrA
VRLVRFLPERLRHLAPEAVAFGAIGLCNLGLYYLIFNALLFIGGVKASVIATLVTTYLAYLANRHWTYRNRARRAVRREYTLFFMFNLVGMLIQAAFVGFAKYGLGLTEADARIELNIASALGIGVATVFRFWSYRTYVFRHAPPAAEVDLPVQPAVSPVTPGGHHAPPEDDFELLAASLELEAELEATERPAEGAARTR